MSAKNKLRINPAYLYAGLAILCWSTISTAFKLSLRYQKPSQLLLGACFTSAIVLFIIILAQKKTGRLFTGGTRALSRSAVMGLLNPFLYYTVLLEAYNRLPAQEAQALNYIWVVMLTLLSIPILRQKLQFRDVSGVLISFCGAIIIGLRGDFHNLRFAEPVGVTLALISTLIWAVFWLYNVKDPRDESIKLFWIFIFGFIYILLYTMLTGQLILHGLPALAGQIYIGVFEMGITFFFWLTALQKSANTARVTNLIFLTPFISLMIIHLILKETIALSTLSGLVLIIAGIIWQQTGNRKQAARK